VESFKHFLATALLGVVRVQDLEPSLGLARIGRQPVLGDDRELPREKFKREVEKHLTGQETEPWEIIYFKLYKSQLPVLERALETAALMLGSDKSRGYCLEMIRADFLAGANLESGDTKPLRLGLDRLFGLLSSSEQQEFLESLATGWVNLAT
jgi:hypothetical protein